MAPNSSTRHRKASGGAKVNFLITSLVLAALGAVGAKIGPAYYYNNKFVEAAGDIATGAARFTENDVKAKILEKAKELKINEALTPGAVTVSREDNDKGGGTCIVRLNYVRKISLYGITTISMPTEKELAKIYIYV